MKLYWSIKSIPEVADMPNEKQKEVWGKFFPKSWRYWQTWVALLVLYTCVALGQVIGMRFSSIHWRILCTVIGCFIGGVVWIQIITPAVRTYIREHLISHEKTN
jgi:hypothetical protein